MQLPLHKNIVLYRKMHKNGALIAKVRAKTKNLRQFIYYSTVVGI